MKLIKGMIKGFLHRLTYFHRISYYRQMTGFIWSIECFDCGKHFFEMPEIKSGYDFSKEVELKGNEDKVTII